MERSRTLRQFCRYGFITAALLLANRTSVAQNQPSNEPSARQLHELNQYPLKDLGELLSDLQKQITFPEPRHQSQLLSLLPESTVFYAAFPNYGSAAQQALQRFRQERQIRPALREWWQSPGVAKAGPQIEMAIQQFSELSQYLGDEIVISGALNEKKTPTVLALAEVRKPGLKPALEFAIQQTASPNQPSLRVFDKQSLAMASEGVSHGGAILVRQDYVIAASDLATLRRLDRQLDTGNRVFSMSSFGQRLRQSYNGGVSVLGAVDLQKILEQAPIPPAQGRTLAETGFSDVKYLLWEHKDVAGQSLTQGELSFAGPRHGVAAWLAAPRDLGGLDFASPNAILVASIALKNLGDVFDDLRTLAITSNPNAFAQFDAIEQGMRINLKDDLLGQLGGEITLEVDDVSAGQPSWKAILQVNDAARLQETFDKLLATAPVSDLRSSEAGVTYHRLTVPSPTKSTELGYAFVDGYLVIGSGGDSVREAVQLHRNGASLAKSSKFLAALPPGHSMKASALYYSDPMKTLGLQLARFSPELSEAVFHGSSESNPVVTCAYADASVIRGASVSHGVDVGMLMIMAAVATPNLLRARNAANESAAAATLRTMVTAQVTYQATYPGRGYARDLAALGFDPAQPNAISPKHAGLIDSSFAKSNCMAGLWCEKSGYKFTFAPVCTKLLCQEFVAVATPVAVSAGTRNFCATSDGVVRFRVEPPLIAPLLASQCRAWAPLE